jgi:predicted transcriptional regulator
MVEIAEVVEGLQRAGISHAEFCRRAEVGTSTWGRVRDGGDCRRSTLRRIETAFAELMQAAAAQSRGAAPSALAPGATPPG